MNYHQANEIIKRVFYKYKLEFTDISLHPLKDTLALTVRLDYLLKRQDTPLTSSIHELFHRNKK